VTVGDPITDTLAVPAADGWLAPPSREVTVPALSALPPVLVAVTSTDTVHVAPPASIPLARLNEDDPAAAPDTAPPQLSLTLAGVAITRPDGSVLLNARPVRVTGWLPSIPVVFGFASVTVSRVVPPIGIVGSANATAIVGAFATVTVADVADPGPLSMDVTAVVWIVYVPVRLAAMGNETSQEPFADSDAGPNLNVFGGVANAWAAHEP
jgi:hypothetical protein